MYKESRLVMDTFCAITIVSPSRKKQKGDRSRFYRDKNLNNYQISFQITGGNTEQSFLQRPIKVSKDTLDVIKKQLRLQIVLMEDLTLFIRASL